MSPEQLIDTRLVERFRADLIRLTAAAPSAANRLGVAVSGGADSLALLLLAGAAFPGCVTAATVDHGLRPDAAAEAADVRRQCATIGVPHSVLRPTTCFGENTGNMQDWARRARYSLLGAWAKAEEIGFVATAHHADDVAESFLMRAARGAGLRGLSAMPAVRTVAFDTVLLLRPLLGWERSSLTAIVAGCALTPAADPSNADERFTRVRLRRLLAASPDLRAEGLARTAAALRDAEEVLEWVLMAELPGRMAETEDGSVQLRVDDLPFELKRRLAIRAIERVREAAGMAAVWRSTHVPDLVRTLEAGQAAVVADVQARPLNARWHFRSAPPRRTG